MKADITTITKKAFDKLSKSKQRIAIAKDVLDRIKLKQLFPTLGDFCRLREVDKFIDEQTEQVSNLLKSSKTKCEVCAKGGLFMSYIGIVNNYKFSDTTGMSEDIDSVEMRLLSKVFTKKQLAMIETAFEGNYYSWNDELDSDTKQKCIEFNFKYDKGETNIYGHIIGTNTLKAICNNIINNNGIFKP